MTLRQDEGCYWCGAQAQTREHAPGKAFFPELEETGGVDLRRNLLTVPACQQHNQDKSDDDEYVAAIISMHIGVDQWPDFHARKIRGLVRNNGSLGRRILNATVPVVVNGVRTGAATIELRRFNRVMESIARAVYMYETRTRWSAKSIEIHTPDLWMDDLAWHRSRDAILEMEKLTGLVSSDAGANAEVFTYRLLTNVEDLGAVAYMRFYSTFRCVAFGTDALERKRKNRRKAERRARRG